MTRSSAPLPTGHRFIVVDLYYIRFLDSTVLSALIDLDRVTAEAGGRLVLVNLSPQVHKTFEVTSSLDRFEIWGQ